MNQQQLFDPVPIEKFSLLSRKELEEFCKIQQTVVDGLSKEVSRLRASNKELDQKSFYLQEQYITIKNKMFGKSSEKSPSKGSKNKSSKSKKKKVQLPSLRYPDLPLIERDIVAGKPVSCPSCQSEMQDSGLTEDSEHLTKIPAQYLVIRVKRHKYRCKCCQGSLVTMPSPKRIVEGGSYSDELIIDAAMSKYCDLIPMERYTKMAAREGVKDLAPNSLINQTHFLSQFIRGAYDKLRDEFLASHLSAADETPHRMLEGDKKSNWYLWGFSTEKTCYLEARDTRSGDVATELLRQSQCRYLMTDVFSGYQKAIRETNEYRKAKNLPLLVGLNCNAHSRRKFKEARETDCDEADDYLAIYGKIYRLNDMLENKKEYQVQRIRRLQKKLFEEMRVQVMDKVYAHSSKSKMGKALRYFLKNYEGLTRFLESPHLPIDNNAQERLLRNPVIGRKTWYGTHSKKGAHTASILFSLVESCKLNKVNPREYFKKLVEDLHQGKDPYTPATYAKATR